MVSTGDWDQLELPLTLAMFSEALHLMPTNKFPDMDRLTMEFYCMFWDVLGPDLAVIWAKFLGSGCSRCHAGSVLVNVVHPDQTYTVPGHTIFDNLYLVHDLLKLGCRDDLFALQSLDQEKAFDRLDHGRMMGLVLHELELWLVLSVYANDMLLVVRDPDLVQVEACQAIYLAASSA
ncbi:unnamed protein product [Caretta caretta]